MRLFKVCALAVVLLSTGAQTQNGSWFVAPGGTGEGTIGAPFGRIQDGLNVARPGDTVVVLPGVYPETIHTVRGGASGRPIRVTTQGPRGSVLVTSPGRVIRIDHPHVTFESLVIDGQYGLADTVTVSSDADFLVLRNLEVRRSSRDLIDIAGPGDVTIESCLIHHALNAVNGRTDAHGIAAGAVRRLTVRDSEIHTFSGDAFQVDPARAAPGWDHVTIERTRMWLSPLVSAENGFAAGAVPGENAIDTKASPDLPRATLTIRDVTAWGFRGGLISNMAAFNLKENVAASVDRVTVHDSEIAFRLRGPGKSLRGGAHVTITNAVVYDSVTAFRYEDNIENLKIWNTTIGGGVTRALARAASSGEGLDLMNLLVRGVLPAEAEHGSNQGVGPEVFVDATAHDYRLAPGSEAIDAGVALPGVTVDRDGIPRPQGRWFDVGAFEWRGK